MAADPLTRLLALRKLPARRIVGLMSGTSGDGVDAALVAVVGSGTRTRVRLLAFESVPFSEGLREELLALAQANTQAVTDLNARLGEVFAEAALAVIAKAELTPEDVHLVGSHGHTACHHPRRATLQLGEAAVIAERTRLPVISDFRARDVAAGGEGAPLVPLVDWLLFRAPDRVRGLLNIGGIANLTVVTPSVDEVFAFDTGPGNMALDLVSRAVWGEPFDRNGSRAASGTADLNLLAELLRHSFLAQPPPRSTGRELFGSIFVDALLPRFRGREEDLLATLTALSAEAVHHAYRSFVLPRGPVQELVVSGGGVHNGTLMGHLARCFAPMPVRSLLELGMDPDAKEAVAFAVLANESLFANPGNLPAATGAAGSRILGKITL